MGKLLRCLVVAVAGIIVINDVTNKAYDKGYEVGYSDGKANAEPVNIKPHNSKRKSFGSGITISFGGKE